MSYHRAQEKVLEVPVYYGGVEVIRHWGKRIQLQLKGPRWGNAWFANMTPAEARTVANAMLALADQIEAEQGGGA